MLKPTITAECDDLTRTIERLECRWPGQARCQRRHFVETKPLIRWLAAGRIQLPDQSVFSPVSKTNTASAPRRGVAHCTRHSLRMNTILAARGGRTALSSISSQGLAVGRDEDRRIFCRFFGLTR